MRTLVTLWAAPLVLFWSWYFLSLHDLNFGFALLTREAHDVVFRFYSDALAQTTLDLYGEPLVIDPAELPAMLARTLVIDSTLLFALVAFRKRKVLGAWLGRQRSLFRAGGLLPGERAEAIQHALQDEGGRGGVDARLPLGA